MSTMTRSDGRIEPLLIQVGVERMRFSLEPNRKIAVGGGHESALVQSIRP